MGLGDFVSSIFGSKNESHPEQYKLDQNAYQYGGTPGGADAAAGRYQAQADTLSGNAAGAYGDAYVARGQQQGAINALQQRANGADLVSNQVAQQQTQQLLAQQQSQAAGARGPAALALAQQNAANSSALGQSQIANQAMIAGSQERLANTQALFGASSGMRAQDLGAAGQLQQGALGYTGAEQNVRAQQLAAQQNREAQNSANYNATQGLQVGVAGQNAQTNQQNAMGLINLAASAAGGAATSDERAKRGISPVGGLSPVVGPDTQSQEAERMRVEREHAAQLRDDPRNRPTQADLERGTGAGQAYTLGQEIGSTIFGAPNGESRLDSRTQRALGDGMASVGAPMSRQATKTAAQTAAAEQAPSVASRAFGGVAKATDRAASLGGGAVPNTATYAAPTYITSDDRAKSGYGGGGIMDRIEAAGRGGGQSVVPFTLSDMLAKTGPMLSDAHAKEEAYRAGAADARALSPDGLPASMLAPKKSDSAATRAYLNQQAAQMARAPEPAAAPASPGLTERLRALGGHALTALRSAPDAMADAIGRAYPAPPGPYSPSDERTKTRVQADPGASAYRSYMADMDAALADAQQQREDDRRGESADTNFQRHDTTQQTAEVRGRRAAEKRAREDAAGRQADEMIAGLDQRRGAEAAVSPMADAARSMRAYEYQYKPQYTPPEQAKGERNVGPMAQNMAADNVARTAVKQDPRSGMLAIDLPKNVKVLDGIAADHQDQIDDLRSTLARILARRA